MLLAGFASFAVARSTSPGGDPPGPPRCGTRRYRFCRSRYIHGACWGDTPGATRMRLSPLAVRSVALHPRLVGLRCAPLNRLHGAARAPRPGWITSW